MWKWIDINRMLLHHLVNTTSRLCGTFWKMCTMRIPRITFLQKKILSMILYPMEVFVLHKWRWHHMVQRWVPIIHQIKIYVSQHTWYIDRTNKQKQNVVNHENRSKYTFWNWARYRQTTLTCSVDLFIRNVHIGLPDTWVALRSKSIRIHIAQGYSMTWVYLMMYKK